MPHKLRSIPIRTHWRMWKHPAFLVLVTLASMTGTLTPGVQAFHGRLMMSDEGTVHTVQCGTCDPGRCPRLTYCEGTPIKDSCNCCTVCSSTKYQPHVPVVGEDKCGEVSCPKFQVCVVNMQGLPLCKCPSDFLCRTNRKRAICGTDGQTYESKCHMRISSCKQGMMVRKKHRGVCSAEDVRDGEIYTRKMRRKIRRRERKRQKQEELRQAAAAIAAEEERASTQGGSLLDGGNQGSDGAMLGGDVPPPAFGADLGMFDSQTRGGGLQVGGELINLGKNDLGANNDENDDDSSSKRKRRKRKKRKGRKSRKGGKKEKKDRRRRRKKRQHRPKSRSKRHRLIHSRYLDNDDAATRKFAEVFGHATWWA